MTNCIVLRRLTATQSHGPQSIGSTTGWHADLDATCQRVCFLRLASACSTRRKPPSGPGRDGYYFERTGAEVIAVVGKRCIRMLLGLGSIL